mmetsp:Transcript_23907/g.74699  ORF Transcript_23907/g.74699 Transcript_23907/m.74699 type:complete len:279 (+) Transcript_23907:486-1322(+)
MRLPIVAMAALSAIPEQSTPPLSTTNELPEKSTPPITVAQTHHPSALRNRIPVLKAILKLLPDSDRWAGDALEVASGTGALLEVLAPAYPQLSWLPSEYVPAETASPEEQWAKHGKIGLRSGLDELANIDLSLQAFKNVKPARSVDLSLEWTKSFNSNSLSLVVCSNTLHITPWACSGGLFKGAGDLLEDGGHLIVYGPFKLHGEFVGEDGGAGNEKFDAKLRSTNDAWGIRDVDDLVELAADRGLAYRGKTKMPANNYLLHFQKISSTLRMLACIYP